MAVEDRLSRTDIPAPIAGVVNELTVYTIGGIVTPAEVLATIVPREARLRVEIQLAPVSIDQVAEGHPAGFASPRSTSGRRQSLSARCCMSHPPPLLTPRLGSTSSWRR